MKICIFFYFLVFFIQIEAVDTSEEKLIQMSIQNASVVFDVGAHSGEWTKICLKYNKNANYYLFEPSFYLADCLRRKFNQCQRISVEQFALSNERKKTLLYQSGSPLAGYYFRSGCHDVDKTEVIETTTIDYFVQERGISHIDLLKIDTEGAELDVLYGASHLLELHQIYVIQFEYGGTYLDANTTLKSVFDFLSSFGYQFMRLDINNMTPIIGWDSSLENYNYTNYCAYLPSYLKTSKVN